MGVGVGGGGGSGKVSEENVVDILVSQLMAPLHKIPCSNSVKNECVIKLQFHTGHQDTKYSAGV